MGREGRFKGSQQIQTTDRYASTGDQRSAAERTEGAEQRRKNLRLTRDTELANDPDMRSAPPASGQQADLQNVSLMQLGNRLHWETNQPREIEMTENIIGELVRAPIEGLKVTVSGNELALLVLQQAAFHAERAGKYQQQHAGLEAAQIEAMAYSNGDPKKALADKQAEHENKARELTFIADHLKLDEDYLLDRAALTEIGVIRSSRGFPF